MLREAFAKTKRERRTALIPYVMGGDPDLETSLQILRALADAGADAIEVGIPYGDPLADGPTIAAAAQRALSCGVAIPDVLRLVRRFTAERRVAVVLFSYFNPIYQYGVERFAWDAASAGAAGAIVPDIALEESSSIRSALASAGIDMPLLVAPSTPRERARRIAAASSGFVYAVSRLGVTGAQERVQAYDRLAVRAAELHTATSLPIAVGFGVKDAEAVRRIGSFADAAIVGSALIERLAHVSRVGAADEAAAFLTELTAGASLYT